MANEVSDHDPLIGQALGHYLVIVKIGSCGMAVPCRAHDELLHLNDPIGTHSSGESARVLGWKPPIRDAERLDPPDRGFYSGELGPR